MRWKSFEFHTYTIDESTNFYPDKYESTYILCE